MSPISQQTALALFGYATAACAELEHLVDLAVVARDELEDPALQTGFSEALQRARDAAITIRKGAKTELLRDEGYDPGEGADGQPELPWGR